MRAPAFTPAFTPAAFAPAAFAPALAGAGAFRPGRAAAVGGIARGVADWIAEGLILMAVALTSVGLAVITNRIIQAGTAPKNIGWGTGATAAAINQTALVAEAAPTTAGGRTVGTESRTTVTAGNDNYRVLGIVTAVSTLAIEEAGLFDAVSAGVMLMRANHGTVNVASGDSIQYTFGLTFVASAA